MFFQGMADGDLSKHIEKTGRKDELGILQNSAASLTNTLSQILEKRPIYLKVWQLMILRQQT